MSKTRLFEAIRTADYTDVDRPRQILAAALSAEAENPADFAE